MKYDLNAATSTATVTFDGEKTSVEKIIERLSEGGYPVSGGHRWVR
ncbi:MAG: cation transporter [Desulfobacterales bacterium]|nr:cation transporter [Desulfobacterales bacterium]